MGVNMGWFSELHFDDEKFAKVDVNKLITIPIKIRIKFSPSAYNDLKWVFIGEKVSVNKIIKERFSINKIYSAFISFQDGNSISENIFIEFDIFSNFRVLLSGFENNDAFICQKVVRLNKSYNRENIVKLQVQFEMVEDIAKNYSKNNLSNKIKGCKTFSNIFTLSQKEFDIDMKKLELWINYYEIVEINAKSQEQSVIVKSWRTTNINNQIKIFVNYINNTNYNFKGYSVELAEQEGNHSNYNMIGKVASLHKDYILVDISRTISRNNILRHRVKKDSELRIFNPITLISSQRIKEGIQKLLFGESANSNLVNFIFDPLKANNYKSNEKVMLDTNELLTKTLNIEQREAVEGVLNSNDMYLIQGPPGTGKTTVIAEICYQNVIRGLKTLIVSQSNLAVDNAISRIMHDPRVRVLRKGKTDLVEKEGEPFIEDNVVMTWLEKTADSCLMKKNQLKKQLELLNNTEIILLSIFERYSEYIKNYQELNNAEQCLNQLTVAKQRFNLLSNEFKSIYANSCYDAEYMIKKIMNFSQGDGDKLWQLAKELMPSVGDCYNRYKLAVSTAYDRIQNLQDIEKRYIVYSEKYKLLNKKLETLKIAFSDSLICELKEVYDNGTVFPTELYSQLYNVMDVIVEFRKNIGFYTLQIELLNSNYEKLVAILNDLKILRNCDLAFNTCQKKVLTGYDIESYSACIATCVKQQEQGKAIISKKPIGFMAILGGNRKWKKEVLCYASEMVNYLVYYKEILCDFNNKINCIIESEDYKNSISRFEVICSAILAHFNNEIYEINESKKTEESKIEWCWSEILLQFSELQNQFIQSIESLEFQYKTVESEVQYRSKEIEVNISEIKEYHIKLPFKLETEIKKLAHTDYEKYYKSVIKKRINNTDNRILIISEWIHFITINKKINYESLKRLYIDNANVIGITCVQSGSPKFTNSYPDFDVVIMDEVSKATLPEIILPALKGKKIVLVGDHRQLPQIIDQTICAEILKSGAYNSSEINSLKQCLFEKLYVKSNVNMKTMLTKQFRMHSDITDVINQFYINDGKLLLGNNNINDLRIHNCQGGDIGKENHILWYDISCAASNAEKRGFNDHSFYNDSEIECIKGILIELNKNLNTNDFNGKKDVGIITFYNAQVEKLEETLCDEKFKNSLNKIEIRVGSVDSFQGKECNIVIASFVRNNPNGNIGFSSDPRRINVALSRAQELMIIVGCSHTFANSDNKDASIIYSNIYDIIKCKDGIRSAFNYKETNSQSDIVQEAYEHTAIFQDEHMGFVLDASEFDNPEFNILDYFILKTIEVFGDTKIGSKGIAQTLCIDEVFVNDRKNRLIVDGLLNANSTTSLGITENGKKEIIRISNILKP